MVATTSREYSLTQDRTIFRIGGLTAMLGAAISILSAMLGPLDLDSHNTEAVMQTFAANTTRMHIHGLGISLGSLLLLWGFVGIQRSLLEGTAGVLARLGLAAAVVATVIHLIGAMMGGSVLPALAEAYLLASPGETAAVLHVGAGFYTFYEALLAPTFLTLAAATLAFAAAVLLANRYPAWLGWAGLLSGIWAAAGGFAFIFAGPIGTADIMLLFVPGFMLAIVWIFVVGIYLWFLGRG
jgi:hypothetical protein